MNTFWPMKIIFSYSSSIFTFAFRTFVRNSVNCCCHKKVFVGNRCAPIKRLPLIALYRHSFVRMETESLPRFSKKRKKRKRIIIAVGKGKKHREREERERKSKAASLLEDKDNSGHVYFFQERERERERAYLHDQKCIVSHRYIQPSNIVGQKPQNV